MFINAQIWYLLSETAKSQSLFLEIQRRHESLCFLSYQIEHSRKPFQLRYVIHNGTNLQKRKTVISPVIFDRCLTCPNLCMKNECKSDTVWLVRRCRANICQNCNKMCVEIDLKYFLLKLFLKHWEKQTRTRGQEVFTLFWYSFFYQV